MLSGLRTKKKLDSAPSGKGFRYWHKGAEKREKGVLESPIILDNGIKLTLEGSPEDIRRMFK